MNVLQAVAAAVLVAFLGLTGFVLYSYGPLGWIEPILANWATRLAAVDLLLSLGVACGFMVKDAREQGIAVAPYLVLAALTGAAGPLAYLVRRLGAERSR